MSFYVYTMYVYNVCYVITLLLLCYYIVITKPILAKHCRGSFIDDEDRWKCSDHNIS